MATSHGTAPAVAVGGRGGGGDPPGDGPNDRPRDRRGAGAGVVPGGGGCGRPRPPRAARRLGTAARVAGGPGGPDRGPGPGGERGHGPDPDATPLPGAGTPSRLGRGTGRAGCPRRRRRVATDGRALAGPVVAPDRWAPGLGRDHRGRRGGVPVGASAAPAGLVPGPGSGVRGRAGGVARDRGGCVGPLVDAAPGRRRVRVRRRRDRGRVLRLPGHVPPADPAGAPPRPPLTHGSYGAVSRAAGFRSMTRAAGSRVSRWAR